MSTLRRNWMKTVLIVLLSCGAAVAAIAQEPTADADAPQFGFGLGFGVAGFEDRSTGEVITYQQLSLQPDVGTTRFGVGLDLTLNYRFTAGSGNEFEVRREDWVPDGETDFFELYLPKFRYVRYGEKGEPVYLRFGSFSDAVLGNGFLVNNYSNELYKPQRRIFGGSVDIDGRAFNFPYIGFETLVGNVAAFDVLAARLYARPLADLNVPILPNLQVGTSVAVDRNPYYFVQRDPQSVFSDDLYVGDEADRRTAPEKEVGMWGVDLRLPILSTQMLSLATFADVAGQNGTIGMMMGAGGRVAGMFVYGAQVRRLGENFQAGYFDTTYDRRRLERLAVFQGTDPVTGDVVETPAHFGWQAQLGLAALQDLLYFNVTMAGPFSTGDGLYPQLEGRLGVREGVVPGFSGLSFDAFYNKFDLREFGDVVSAENALIGAQVNFRSGPVIISLVYDLAYDPYPPAGEDRWRVTSRLESTIALR